MVTVTVGIAQTPRGPYDWQIADAVREAVALAGGLNDIVNPGALILIKPNLVTVPPGVHSGACTSPSVCKALADMVIELGGRPVIAESAAVGCDTEAAIRFMGYEALRAAGYQVVDLKATPTAKRSFPQGDVLKEIHTFELALQADAIITVPVLKTHDQCEVTLALKNQKGLITDKEKRHVHKVGVAAGVADINLALRPAFAVIDGIWCQEGLGCVHGRPVEMDLIIAGRDLVAVDSVGSMVMGFDPKEIPIIMEAQRRGLGTANPEEIIIAGRPLEVVRRRFMRCIEDDRMHLPGSPAILHAEGTCTGCRLGVGSALWEMRGEGTLSYAAQYTIVTGNVDVPEDIPPDKLLALGNCCPPALRRRAIWVRGCPPNNVFVKQAIIDGRSQE